MNKLKGHITEIESSGNLSRVDIALSDEIKISTVVIETTDTAPYLKKGNGIHILFKETEVILSRDPEIDISLVNRIPGKIAEIVIGDLFCEVTIDSLVGQLKSLVNKVAWKQWPMELGDQIIALVKINEIMLKE